MDELFVLLMISAAFTVVLFVGLTVKSIFPFVLGGCVLRVVLLAAYGAGLFSPPGADEDAVRFTEAAVSLSYLSWLDLFEAFDPRSAFSYSIIGASIFKVFGFHELSMPALNLFVGVINISLACVIVYRSFGRSSLSIAALLICIYPFSALNSIVALREEFAVFFFLCGLFVILEWVRSGHLGRFFLANVFFVFASFVHPALIAASLASAVCFCYQSFVDIRQLHASPQRGLVSLAAGIVLMFAAVGILAKGVELGKGLELTLDTSVLSESLEKKFASQVAGGSAYPPLIANGNPVSQPWLIPARMIYFLYSPFPWDVRSGIHLVGLLASALYMWLTFRSYMAWRAGSFSGRRRVFVVIFLALSLVFAVGVTNSGTAIRHKTKFFPLLVLLAAPTFRKRIVIGSSVAQTSIEVAAVSRRIGK